VAPHGQSNGAPPTSMPTRPYTASERCDAEDLMEVAFLLEEGGSSSDESVGDMLLDVACEPFVRRRLQDIGPERLSVERLQRESCERGFDDENIATSTWTKFMFRLEHLPAVVAALDPPAGFRTASGVFTGEEGVLLLLRRFRTADSLDSLVYETGRSTTHISQAVAFMTEHIEARFPWLLDERSLSSFAPHFEQFAAKFRAKGMPMDDLIAFIDGKLWAVCKPGRFQRVLYSGHKRVHGCKTQGVVFPNGIQPYPYGPCHGSTHDSTILRDSNLLRVMHDVCRGGQYEWPGAPGGLGKDFRLFGDSAYPVSFFLWHMFKGVMSRAQQLFNADMRWRIAAEWGFGKICNLWPYLDYRKKQKVLLSPVGLHLKVGNVLTNMHTCLYGSIVSHTFKMDPPALSEYMCGGPYYCNR